MPGRYALIIGNSEYDDSTLAKLKTPEADVLSLAAALRQADVGGFDWVQELINQPEATVRRAISAFFANKKPDEMLLLYFSGHGVLDDQGRLFLAVKDTQRDLLKATAISASFITDEMDSCRSKRQLLILDCCHSGAFARGSKGEVKAMTQATFEGNGYGRVVLTASVSTQYALEGDQVIEQASLSLFTHYLLEGLTSGKADAEQDGWVTLDEWYDYAYERVVSETPNQTPRKWVYNQQGELIIARNPVPQSVELPEELKQALESKFVGVRLEALEELRRLLYGNNPALSQAAHQALQRLAEHDDSRRIVSVANEILATYQPETPSETWITSHSAKPDSVSGPGTPEASPLEAELEAGSGQGQNLPAKSQEPEMADSQKSPVTQPLLHPRQAEQEAEIGSVPATLVKTHPPMTAPYHCELSPISGGVRLRITNLSPSPQTLSVETDGAQRALLFTPVQAQLDLLPGQTTELDIHIKPQRRLWTGNPKRYPYTLRISAAEGVPQVLGGEYLSRPLLPLWAVILPLVVLCGVCSWWSFSYLYTQITGVISEAPPMALTEIAVTTSGGEAPAVQPTLTTPTAGENTASETAPVIVPPATSVVEPPAPLPRIAFMSDRDGNLEIYRMNLDGGEQVRLTNDPAEDGFPMWSPDGRQIVFHSNRGGDFEIYVMSADGSRQRPLTEDNTADTFPAWSPDARQIIFQSKRDKDKNIYVMDADGSHLFRLFGGPGDDLSPRWSPDGKLIIFASDQTGNSEIYLMEADGSNVRQLTDDPGEDRAPVWAADSRRIAFASNRNGNYDLFILNVFSGELIQLTSSMADENYPSWTPDGDSLVFTSDQTGNFDIYLRGLQDGALLQLTTSPGNDTAPSVSP